ncbi:hypothetical protein L1987_00625 [Smallanthus sonchifolius]|uniref:Uncharacterized protein n=1 Tax=Smallanthus sonchifolius TaxID=185202 RepID=A0ACB9K2V0_9ASTR|nr:hypothetical protein L1987_00625 [Smallanthus sonchifolius]
MSMGMNKIILNLPWTPTLPFTFTSLSFLCSTDQVSPHPTKLGFSTSNFHFTTNYQVNSIKIRSDRTENGSDED